MDKQLVERLFFSQEKLKFFIDQDHPFRVVFFEIHLMYSMSWPRFIFLLFLIVVIKEVEIAVIAPLPISSIIKAHQISKSNVIRISPLQSSNSPSCYTYIAISFYTRLLFFHCYHRYYATSLSLIRS